MIAGVAVIAEKSDHAESAEAQRSAEDACAG